MSKSLWILLASICAFAALETTAHAAKAVYPAEQWKTEAPKKHGLDAAKLRDAAEMVKQIEERYGFLVVKDGVIVHEIYWSGDKDTLHPAFSVAKGFGSALVGIAQTRGYLNVKDRISDWLPIHHPDIVEGATIEHVLSMTAGHEPPGSRFRYTSGNILNSLPAILWQVTGMAPHEFYEKELGKPMGLNIDWPHLDKGWIQIGTQRVQGLGPLRSSHRDLARLGWLWLNKGEWNGQQLISEQYIEASITAPFPEANSAYGYLWWLNTAEGTWRSAYPVSGEGKRIPDAPANVYTAAGANSQLIFVVPDHNTVVVTMGNTRTRDGTPTNKVWAAINSFLPEN